MDGSDFEKLPGELRNKIYELVALPPTRAITVQDAAGAVHGYGSSDNRESTRTALALALTCKGIRLEVLSLFYSSNTFRFAVPAVLEHQFSPQIGLEPRKRRIDGIHTILLTWLLRMGKESAPWVRSIVLDLGRWDVWYGAHHGAAVVEHTIRVLKEFKVKGPKIRVQFDVDWTMQVPQEREPWLFKVVLQAPWNERVNKAVFRQIEDGRRMCRDSEILVFVPICWRTLSEYEDCMNDIFWELGNGG
jgi:hypothetical protein